MSNEFQSAMQKLDYFCRKADVQGIPRITITFDTPRDAAYFQEEIKREMSGTFSGWGSHDTFSDFSIYGIKVRIL